MNYCGHGVLNSNHCVACCKCGKYNNPKICKKCKKVLEKFTKGNPINDFDLDVEVDLEK